MRSKLSPLLHGFSAMGAVLAALMETAMQERLPAHDSIPNDSSLEHPSTEVGDQTAVPR
jgi:hypothetical protein